MFRADTARARIARGIILGVTVGTALALFGIANGIKNLRKLERRTYATLATSATRRLDARIETDRARLRAVGGSQSLYSALEIGQDTVLSRDQLLQLTANTGVRFVGLYDSEGQPLYRWSTGSKELGPVVPVNAISRMLYGRQAVAGMVTTESGPLWIAGAPVVPSNDDTSPILGYLIVAQPFTPALFVAGTEQAELLIADDPKDGFQTRIDPNRNGDSIVVRFGLTDIYAQQPIVAAVYESRYWFRQAERSFWFLGVLTVILAAGMAWLGIRFGYQWMVQPTIRLNDALTVATKGPLPTLLPPVADEREWKSIVASANRLITKTRHASERFDRLLSASNDATWERDLVSGEWSGSPAFYRLLEVDPVRFATPLAVFDARLRSENRQKILDWLAADPVPGEPLSVETATARPGSVDLPIRFEVTAVPDSSGALTRIQGRVVDVSTERNTKEKLDAAAAIVGAATAATGDFLAVLGRTLREAPSAVNPRHIEILGMSLANQKIEVDAATFDLYQMLQEAAGTENELLLAPGLSQYVSGDEKLLRELLLALRADFTGRQVVRAMTNPKKRDGIILSIEGQPGPIDLESRRSADQAPNAPSHQDLRWNVSRAIVSAVNGSIEVKLDDKRAIVTVNLVLPPAPPPAMPEVADPAANGDWRTDESVTFVQETPPEPPLAVPSKVEPPTATPVELVADATITIDLDAIGEKPTPPESEPIIGDLFVAELKRRSASAEKAVKMVLAEMPARMAELMGAARAKELEAMLTNCAAIQRLAALIEAEELRGRCVELVKAIEKGYLESHTRAVEPIRVGWNQVREMLTAIASTRGEPDQGPAIDPGTMKQLIAERAAGLGAHLVTMFLSDVPPRIEALTKALRAGNQPAAANEASQLKGMCTLVGAQRLGDLCEAARLNPSDSATAAIRHEWDRVHRALGELAAIRGTTT